LFSVAQSTGIEFASLSNQLVNYGAPLRQIGFDFEQSALLIGKFEKEGVNAELVLGSLRQALGKMAREGEPAIETFQRTTEAIKNAGTPRKPTCSPWNCSVLEQARTWQQRSGKAASSSTTTST